jgi:hypothetical protein
MNSDPHAPYVKQLAEAGDWAALVRYWMANQHEAALDAAVSLLRRCVLGGEGGWQPLVNYLEAVKAEPLDPGHQPPEKLVPYLDDAQRLTLGLLRLYPRTALCEMALQAPPEQQSQLLQIGFQSAQQAAQAGLAVGDQAVAAFFSELACAWPLRSTPDGGGAGQLRGSNGAILERRRHAVHRTPRRAPAVLD